jgi:transketolase
VAKGAYVLREGTDVVLLATGSEVGTALEAADSLRDRGISARVVSMPCWEAFEEQDRDYRAKALGAGLPIVSIEAGSSFGWDRYADMSIGIDTFGASAPDAVLSAEFGFSATAIADAVDGIL